MQARTITLSRTRSTSTGWRWCSTQKRFFTFTIRLCMIISEERRKNLMTLVDQQDEKALSNRSPRRQNLDKKIGVIRQKKTSQQQVLFQYLIFLCHFRVFISPCFCCTFCSTQVHSCALCSHAENQKCKSNPSSQVISKKEEEELLALSPQPSIGNQHHLSPFYASLFLSFKIYKYVTSLNFPWQLLNCTKTLQ